MSNEPMILIVKLVHHQLIKFGNYSIEYNGSNQEGMSSHCTSWTPLNPFLPFLLSSLASSASTLHDNEPPTQSHKHQRGQYGYIFHPRVWHNNKGARMRQGVEIFVQCNQMPFNNR